MEGPVANEPIDFTYNLSGVRTNLARYKFSLSTCSGCHAGDTGRSFQFQMVKSDGKNKRAFLFLSWSVMVEVVCMKLLIK